MSTIEEQFERIMQAQPEAEHRWLEQLVGEWTFEARCDPDADEPAATSGVERVRSLGGLWIVAEGRGEMPGGGEGLSIMTLGYDPQTRRYVGTWAGSMMTHLWVYDGELDADRRVLTLQSDGPVVDAQGRPVQFRDVIEITGENERTLTGLVLREDGEWQTIMTARYRRKGEGSP